MLDGKFKKKSLLDAFKHECDKQKIQITFINIQTLQGDHNV
jgi:hypothetical protein